MPESKDTYSVEVVVQNKPLARDPEGETIHKSLILKGGFSEVTGVRAGKLLRITVQARSKTEAEALVKRMCDELRIYNPAAHTCEIRTLDGQNGKQEKWYGSP